MLADSLGPSVDQIQGNVASRSDSTFHLRVTAVQYINGQRNRWTGEPLTIRTELVRDVRQKQFSRGRTWTLAGLALAGTVALILSRDLLTGGGVTSDKKGGPPPSEQ